MVLCAAIAPGIMLGLAVKCVGWLVVMLPCLARNVDGGWLADHGCRISLRWLLLVFLTLL